MTPDTEQSRWFTLVEDEALMRLREVANTAGATAFGDIQKLEVMITKLGAVTAALADVNKGMYQDALNKLIAAG